MIISINRKPLFVQSIRISAIFKFCVSVNQSATTLKPPGGVNVVMDIDDRGKLNAGYDWQVSEHSALQLVLNPVQPNINTAS